MPRPPLDSVVQFRARVLEHYARHGRHDLPWRQTHDPWAVLVSEVMLQQTQVARVSPYYERWMTRWPDAAALASAPLDEVLSEWQGLGYNRRAIALMRCAQEVVDRGGTLPRDEAELRSLPGIGPATAAGVRVFAFGLPALYLETNVRAALLHDFFPDCERVPDSELLPVLEAVLDEEDPRTWYQALLDYGVHVKRTVPNPSRRSRHHARQSAFEGSTRQKRARLLRAVLDEPGLQATELTTRTGIDIETAETVLAALAAEGFVREESGSWRIA